MSEIENLVEKIKELSREVYDDLGPGQSESTYHKALTYELQDHNIVYETEMILPILYKGKRNVNHFRCDIVIDKKLILELKSISKGPFMEKDNEVIQLRNYLRYSGIDHGLLINFSKNSNIVFFKYVVKE